MNYDDVANKVWGVFVASVASALAEHGMEADPPTKREERAFRSWVRSWLRTWEVTAKVGDEFSGEDIIRAWVAGRK